jgi:hypothetical protein
MLSFVEAGLSQLSYIVRKFDAYEDDLSALRTNLSD